jgi:hypothetical protein
VIFIPTKPLQEPWVGGALKSQGHPNAQLQFYPLALETPIGHGHGKPLRTLTPTTETEAETIDEYRLGTFELRENISLREK